MHKNKFYHVFVQRSILREKKHHYQYEINLTKSQVLNDFVIPLKMKQRIICNGDLFESQEIMVMRFYYTHERLNKSSRYELDNIIHNNAEDVTREILDLVKQVPFSQEIRLDSHKVFIVHGHDSESKLELARLIEKDFNLNALILHDEPNKGSTIIEKLERVSQYPGYVFVLLTPDDIGTENPHNVDINQLSKDTIGELDIKFRHRSRQNVILELGYFMAKLGRNRVCCLYKGDVEIPSDILGVLYLEFKKSVGECYSEIRRELISAGFSIKL